MLIFQMSFGLKFCFPCSLYVSHWVRLPLCLLYIPHQFLHFFSIWFSTSRSWNPIVRSMWSECWPRLGHCGVLRGTQAAMMMVFCGFGNSWGTLGCSTQIPLKGGLVALALGVLSIDSLWFSAPSGTAWAAESHITWRLHPVTDRGGERMVWSSAPVVTTLKTTPIPK